MRSVFVKGTRFPFGATCIELPSDTELEVVGVDSIDHLAETFATADPKTFGAHLDSLKHSEVVVKDFGGELKEIDVDVSYGAGGARIETQIGDPRPVKTVAPVSAPVTAPAFEPNYPPSFPGYPQLVAARVDKLEKLRGATIEQLETIPGVEAATAQRIHAAVLAHEEEEDRREQQLAADRESAQEQAAADAERLQAEQSLQREAAEKAEAERLEKEAAAKAEADKTAPDTGPETTH